jgi:transposase
MTPKTIHIGIDVSKDKLDVSIPGSKRTVSFSNSKSGVRRIAELARRNGWSVCCEATGVYSAMLIDGCHAAGVPVVVANPYRIRRYAQGKGILEKTDAIDARVIAQYADENQPRPASQPSGEQRLLRELTDAREFYLRLIQEIAGRLEQCPPGGTIRKDFERTLWQQRKTLAGIEKRRERLVASSPELSHRMTRFTLVQGIGQTVAMNVMAAMPELGSLSDKEAAKLAGVAPISNESGREKKKRKIAQGRLDVRSSLYMAALVAAYHNPVLKPFYARLVAKGKPRKVALAAVMRKLVVLLNRLVRCDTFVPLSASTQHKQTLMASIPIVPCAVRLPKPG